MYPQKHTILFTGHMIDKPGRPAPRFPASEESMAKETILEKLEQIIRNDPKSFSGIAGGACGGDILFHESAAELHITTEMFLLFPKEQFIQESVSFAGRNWVDRFHALSNQLPVHLLPTTDAFPGDTNEFSIWERSNRWMLHHALQNGGAYMSLLALWNGKTGDGTGGTAHMANSVKQVGGNVIIIDTHSIFQL